MAGVKGKSGGDRRSKKVQGLPEAAPLPQTRDCYDRLIRVLNAKPIPDEATKDPEAAGWRVSWDSADGKRRDHARFFMYRMRDGDPPRTINHVHDKALEVNMNVKLSEVIREVRERKLEYERSRR